MPSKMWVSEKDVARQRKAKLVSTGLLAVGFLVAIVYILLKNTISDLFIFLSIILLIAGIVVNVLTLPVVSRLFKVGTLSFAIVMLVIPTSAASFLGKPVSIIVSCVACILVVGILSRAKDIARAKALNTTAGKELEKAI